MTPGRKEGRKEEGKDERTNILMENKVKRNVFV